MTNDIEERFNFNTAISAVMELVNTLYQVKRPDKSNAKALSVIREAIESIIVLLVPIVPHVTEELWEMLGQSENLSDVSWPTCDESVAAEEKITIVIQINGKLRSRIVVSADESAERIKELALSDERISKLVTGKELVKEIYVPKKLVNIVVK